MCRREFQQVAVPTRQTLVKRCKSQHTSLNQLGNQLAVDLRSDMPAFRSPVGFGSLQLAANTVAPKKKHVDLVAKRAMVHTNLTPICNNSDSCALGTRYMRTVAKHKSVCEVVA